MPKSTRQDMLDAAVEVMRSNTQLSMMLLASRAGVSRATAYRCFPDGIQTVLNDLKSNLIKDMVATFNSDELRPESGSNIRFTFEKAMSFGIERVFEAVQNSNYAQVVIISGDKLQIQALAFDLHNSMVLKEYVVRTIAVWGPNYQEGLKNEKIKYVAERFSWDFFTECMLIWQNSRKVKSALNKKIQSDLVRSLKETAKIPKNSSRGHMALPRVYALDQIELRKAFVE